MYEDLILVCEGECNPDIRDYDQAAARMDANPSIRPIVVDWVRRLHHTKHIATTNEHFNQNNGCWDRTWVCAECGHHRRF